jgi:hypothetical protein
MARSWVLALTCQRTTRYEHSHVHSQNLFPFCRQGNVCKAAL